MDTTRIDVYKRQQLQQRHKWKFAKDNFSIGDLVLLIEDNLPPLAWKFGVITATFPGPDNLIREMCIRDSIGPRQTAREGILTTNYFFVADNLLHDI